MTKRNIAIKLLAAIALVGCTTLQPASLASQPQSEAASIGAVSAADPRAQEAGLEMLRAGGNATDAAIAVMLALTVVEPQSSGIGGGGFFVRGTAEGSIDTIDGRETAPAGAGPDWFLRPDGSLPPFDESVRSGLSVGVPGNVALAYEAHRKFGKLPWATLFEPAIRLAREGFEINVRLHSSITGSSDTSGFDPDGRALFFGADGNANPPGTLVHNPQLAATFERLAAQGPKAFYDSAEAGAMAQEVAADTPRPGAMTAADVAGYRAKERAAVCGSYRGYRICGMGPPSSGGIAVLGILGALERFDLKSLGADNPATWHLFVEAQRLAYADRELYLADSDYIDVPVAGLVEKDYLGARSALIDPSSTIASVVPGTPRGAPAARADGDEPEEHGTSHFAAVDSSGTMVSYTSTIESAFGSGIVFKGFYLNNELTDFSRAPEADGRPVANRVEGGKRPRSSMAPSVVWDRQGKPFLMVGAAGGATIPVQTAKAIIGVVDFGLSASDAIGLPFIMAFGDTVMVEEGTWLEAAIPQLQALGHARIVAREAPVKAGAILHTAQGWESARDPRLEGKLGMQP